MSGLGLAAFIIATLWLAVLTLASILMIRQMSLISIRVSLAGSLNALENDGPEIGTDVSDELSELLSTVPREPWHLLALSPSCLPCRDLAAKLDTITAADPIVAVITGDRSLAQGFTHLLPTAVQSVFDPQARQVLEVLGVHSRPFCLTISDGKVTGKTHVRAPGDVQALIARPLRSERKELAHAR